MTQNSQAIVELNPPTLRDETIRRRQQPALTLFAIGLIGMGALALIYGDFALG